MVWDPFLSAEDVLNALFYSHHANSDLRALTAGNELPFEAPINRDNDSLPGGELSAPPLTFAQKRRVVLENTKSNLRGLPLEYRVKTGSAGWAFHDRFLIFPQTDRGALAWSLGTSVNSLGKQHHILQRVDDGQLVMDAFTELWDQLNQPEHLIWKHHDGGHRHHLRSGSRSNTARRIRRTS